MAYETILFDLDGTLTDSGPGIMNAVRYALNKMGIEETDVSRLRTFIGPPLHENFSKLYSMDYDTAWVAVNNFREYYLDKGWMENEPYPGIPELLRDLREAGKTLMVATSKPDATARKVLEHFDLTKYFHRIQGATFQDTHCQKADVIRMVLAECPHSEPVVMVGDRENDCEGAAKNAIPCIGVLYGYGDRPELESAGAAQIAPTVEDLRALLLG